MTYPRAVALTWGLALLLACLLAYDVTHAGQLSLDIKGGIALPIRTTPDGTYWQEPFEHHVRPVALAYAVGVSYAYTPSLSFQAHWLDLGSSRIKGRSVSDENYDHLHHRCKAQCNVTYGFRATDTLKGFDLTATYTWQREGLQPFVKGGIAILRHQAIFRNEDGTEDRFNGILPELELGAGLAYQWAYVEVNYLQGMNFGGQNLPISTQQIVTFAGVRIPLGF